MGVDGVVFCELACVGVWACGGERGEKMCSLSLSLMACDVGVVSFDGVSVLCCGGKKNCVADCWFVCLARVLIEVVR